LFEFEQWGVAEDEPGAGDRVIFTLDDIRKVDKALGRRPRPK
jgi:hypothetical protein